jgi:hypothetical protein
MNLTRQTGLFLLIYSTWAKQADIQSLQSTLQEKMDRPLAFQVC